MKELKKPWPHDAYDRKRFPTLSSPFCCSTFTDPDKSEPAGTVVFSQPARPTDANGTSEAL